jgi:hypothetical protein
MLGNMPGWASTLLQALGLATPGVYAIAIVGGFAWLDGRASDEAKTALMNWLQSKQYDAAAIGDATIEMFDRVYTNRLLSWRAFARSAVISTCLAIIFLYETYSGKESDLNSLINPPDLKTFENALVSFGDSVISNIVSDYVSLFAVRHLLVLARARPLFALWIGPVVGIFIVAVLNFLLGGILMDWYLHWRGIVPETVGFWKTLYGVFFLTITVPEWRDLLIAALVVHLWLPLFAIAAGLVSALRWTQWFLRDGRQRPYQAIGYLVAAMVLVGGFVWKGIRFS